MAAAASALDVDDDEAMMAAALTVATESPDLHRRVGCVIARRGSILTSACNDVVMGIEASPAMLERPEKYKWIEHAERNAVYRAAREGISLRGATAYVTLWPCENCCRALIQSGVTRLVARRAPDFSDPRWGEEFRVVVELLERARVEVATTAEE